MEKLLLTLIDGLNLGSVYALVALGYTMVYGIAKMLNFAHGDVIMVGAYTIFVCMTTFNLPIWLTFIICIVICSLLGFTVEKLAYKPLRGSSPLAVLITAIGVSYFLQNAALLFANTQYNMDKQFFTPFLNLGQIKFQNVIISGVDILIWVTTAAIMVIMMIFIKKTKTGRAMLAVSEDKGAAQLMGVNVNRTISITFIIGSALAAIASILFAAKYQFVESTMGSLFGIKAFAAAVFGGIGSIPGAVIGGLIIGIVEAVTSAFLPSSVNAASDGFAFIILIIMLVLKPAGLLGKQTTEKV
jgi:hypothetical protein